MTSAKILNFPRTARRRYLPPPEPVRYIVRPYSQPDTVGFFLLLLVTIPAAFVYLSGAVNVERHDALYAVLLALVWGIYFLSDKLLRTRLGPVLVRIGRLLSLASAAGFFGFVYWLVLSHP